MEISKDEHDEAAEKLLPCLFQCREIDVFNTKMWAHTVGCPYPYRPAVAAALRETYTRGRDDAFNAHVPVCQAGLEAALATAKLDGLRAAKELVIAWSNNQLAESNAEKKSVSAYGGTATIRYGGEAKKHAAEMLANASHAIQQLIDAEAKK